MKKLIALAVAALPMAAMADVTLYGTVEAALETGKGLKHTNNTKSTTRVDDTGSLIGFKGAEDLGNGLKAIWQIEQSLNVDGTTGAGTGNDSLNRWATRDSFIGLEGNFGKVRVGRLSTYPKSAMGQSDAAWIYGAGVNGLQYHQAQALDGRTNNAIAYDSPAFGGFSFGATYGFDEVRTTLPLTTTRSNAATWSLGGTYANAGFYGSAGYVSQADTDSTLTKSSNYWRVEGGYNANNILAALSYGQAKQYGGAVDALKYKEVALTLGYTMGALTPKFTYGKIFSATTAGVNMDATELNQFIVGVDYALSKRTVAYTSYGHAKHGVAVFADGGRSENTFAVGMQHKF